MELGTEYLIPLNEEQEQKVAQLTKDKIFIALHEHPVLFPKNIEETVAYNTAGREFCAYEALSKSYLDCVFDNMMDGVNTISSPAGWKWQDVLHDLGMRLCDIAHQDFLIHCKKLKIYIEHTKKGK